MDILVKYLSSEAIENTITCLHYKMDKVIFFGHPFTISEESVNITGFLQSKCGVREVIYIDLVNKELPKTMKYMKDKIFEHAQNEDRIFFDLTGGDGLCEAGLTLLGRELSIPMHLYDIWNDLLIEMDEQDSARISRQLRKRETRIDIADYIRMVGGVIIDKMHKGYKNSSNPNIRSDCANLWNISLNYYSIWTKFCGILHDYRQEDQRTVIHSLSTQIRKRNLKVTADQIFSILRECEAAGLIRNLDIVQDGCSFDYKNEEIMSFMQDEGSILEMQTYTAEKQTADDCRIGVHLDWDGFIDPDMNKNVINEIDVLRLDHYILTFISCKAGKVNQNALYELETVTRRFGGKYSKMEIHTTAPISEIDQNRAKLIGIQTVSAII